MSRVELELSTGHTAVIEVEDESMIPFLLGAVKEPPPHPDDKAQKITDDIGDAIADDDGVHSFGVKVIAVRMVSAREQAEEVSKSYQDMAARFLREGEDHGDV